MSFRFLSRALALTIGLAIAAGMVLAMLGFDSLWKATAGPADLGPVDFATLTKTKKPNQALICPPGFCPAAEAKDQVDRPAPVYALAAPELKETLLKSLENESDLERVDDGSELNRLRFVQRTKVLRFPDTIRVAIVPLQENRSSLALYSQSQIGHSDMGVNLQRLKRWLKRLSEYEVKPAS